ncbi:uncharacterized protein LOC117179915 [Belonocnema kinseyi]|uniref:uncharacterized protein LOC117179915 n=1 Tax=Belonocnema kinseyi TaxID=2817044 RepID=UPI00143E071E|nr:uncharacterized protein LOC117179915 [Belonocnema kinseyi]XP_033228012.1 uncharacterized protein LOC117179915 [Belonocnema kinseyi]
MPFQRRTSGHPENSPPAIFLQNEEVRNGVSTSEANKNNAANNEDNIDEGVERKTTGGKSRKRKLSVEPRTRHPSGSGVSDTVSSRGLTPQPIGIKLQDRIDTMFCIRYP